MFLKEIWKTASNFDFFEAVSKHFSSDFLLISGAFLSHRLRLYAHRGNSDFCNMFCSKSQISRVQGFDLFNYFGAPLGFAFSYTVVFLLVPKVVLGLLLEATTILCKQQVCRSPQPETVHVLQSKRHGGLIHS